MHPSTFPLINERLCGGRASFCQFDLRHTPKGAGPLSNNIHRDLPDAVCSIHYLTDTSPDTPAFAVVPRSHNRERYPAVQDALTQLANYQEVPIYAAAGSCVIYSTDLFHCRWDGTSDAPRRTMQEYFYTAQRSGKTAGGVGWVLVPERLAQSANSATRAFFSSSTIAQRAFARAGYTDEARQNASMLETFGKWRGNGGLTFPPPPRSSTWR
jgi:hypothetical protein